MRRTSTGIALGVIISSVAACSSGGGSDSNAGGEDTAEGLSIGFSAPVAAQPGQAIGIRAMEQAAEDLGWDLQVFDANLQVSAQVSDVQTMIQQGKDAISLWPLDTGALSGSFAQAQEAGIPVISINNEGENVDVTVWWEASLCSEGGPAEQEAALIAEAKPGGRVAVMGGPPVPTIQEAVACFRAAAEAAGLEIVTQVDNASDAPAGGATLAADVLTRYPDIDAFWAYNDSSALGISSSVISAGLTVQSGDTDGIVIVGNNGDPEAIEAIRQGRLTRTWDPDVYATGFAVIRAVRDFVESESTDPVIIEAQYFDSTNIDGYVEPEERPYTVDDFPTVESGD